MGLSPPHARVQQGCPKGLLTLLCLWWPFKSCKAATGGEECDTMLAPASIKPGWKPLPMTFTKQRGVTGIPIPIPACTAKTTPGKCLAAALGPL